MQQEKYKSRSRQEKQQAAVDRSNFTAAVAAYIVGNRQQAEQHEKQTQQEQQTQQEWE